MTVFKKEKEVYRNCFWISTFGGKIEKNWKNSEKNKNLAEIFVELSHEKQI